MTRGGQQKDRTESERKCIATGDSQPKGGLIRFVVGPDNVIVPDILEKLPGRGIWVSASADALKKAVNKGLFSRAAKTHVSVSDDLLELVPQLLAKRLIERLSLARKAGHAFCGFEKVKSALVSGDARALFQASDGSESMKRKLRPPEGGDTYCDCLDARELGVAFGRDSVIHAAITAGGLADLCVAEALRLRGFRRKKAPV